MLVLMLIMNDSRTSENRMSDLSSLIAVHTKKKTITTIEKTKLDWEKSKALEGDSHELAQFAKDG